MEQRFEVIERKLRISSAVFIIAAVEKTFT